MDEGSREALLGEACGEACGEARSEASGEALLGEACGEACGEGEPPGGNEVWSEGEAPGSVPAAAASARFCARRSASHEQLSRFACARAFPAADVAPRFRYARFLS